MNALAFVIVEPTGVMVEVNVLRRDAVSPRHAVNASLMRPETKISRRTRIKNGGNSQTPFYSVPDNVFSAFCHEINS